MPSRVIRRSRRHGRMMNHQMAIGRPTTITAVQMKRIAFMNVGGSVGPGGTRSKLGPVIQRIHTYSWKARIAPPTAAQIFTWVTLDWGGVPSDASLSDSVIAGFFLCDRSLTTPSPLRLRIACTSELPPEVADAPKIYQRVSQ